MLQEKRRKMHNTMHLAACIVCNDSSVRILRLITISGRPSRHAHGMQVTECATQAGCARWWASMAVGDWITTATDLVKLFATDASLKEMGFIFAPLDKDSVDGIVEQRHADSAHRLLTELLATEVRDMLFFLVELAREIRWRPP